VFEANRRIQCKCHGISGSCEVKTCWYVAPALRLVSDELKTRYDSAVPVRLHRSRQGVSKWPQQSPASIGKLIVTSGTSAVDDLSPFAAIEPSDVSLVYFRSSPNYCTDTVGRSCNSASDCERVCCGRGHVTQKKTVIDARCRCRFHYCCHVTCEPCERTVEDYICR
jgi:wnt family